MESNRKRKGFMKGKLVMSIYKATKPSNCTVQYNNNKLTKHPCPQYPSSSLGFNTAKQAPDHVTSQAKQKVNPPPSSTTRAHHVEFIVNQDQLIPQPKQKVSFLLPPADTAARDSYSGIIDNPNAVDESVDLKAASYISSVRERLIRLQRMNSEHNKLQDTQH